MNVHNRPGSGYKGEIYQVLVEVFDLGKPVVLFYLDLPVEENVVLESKAFSHQLTNDELAQVLNYLKAADMEVGLLFNFGCRKLECRRVFPPIDKKSPVQRVGWDNVRESNLPESPPNR